MYVLVPVLEDQSAAKYIMQSVCSLTALQTSHQKKDKEQTCRAVMHAAL